MSMIHMIVVLGMAFSVSAAGDLKVYNTVDTAVDESDVNRVLMAFQNWNNALASLDAKKVAALYAPKGVLVPTVSNKVRNTPALILAYFETFLLNKPTGVIDEYNIRAEEFNEAGQAVIMSNSGLYTFTTIGGVVKARFTFLYERAPKNTWLIKLHHSSVLPSMYEASILAPGDMLTPNSTDRSLSALDVKGVLNAFTIWNAALATKDAAKVNALYMPQAVLLPTLSDDVRCTTRDRLDYFNFFLPKGPQGVINSYDIRRGHSDLTGAPDQVTNSGVYTFTFDDGSTARARYSFSYIKVNGQFMIMHQHSSLMPEV